MICKLCSILRVHHKTLAMKYLTDVISHEYKKLYLHEYLEKYDLTVNHNTLRSWNRLIDSIQEHLPEVIDTYDSDSYMTFNDKIFCLVDMLNGSPCRFDLTNRVLFNKRHIISSMQSLLNISEAQACLMYDNLYRESDLPESILYKVSNRFSDSVRESRLSKNFMNNLRYYYSY